MCTKKILHQKSGRTCSLRNLISTKRLCFYNKTVFFKDKNHLVLKVQVSLLLTKGKNMCTKIGSASKTSKDLFTEKFDIQEKAFLF